MVDQTIKEFGRIDYNFSSAGVSTETNFTLKCLSEGLRVVSTNPSMGFLILRTLARCFNATRLIPCQVAMDVVDHIYEARGGCRHDCIPM